MKEKEMRMFTDPATGKRMTTWNPAFGCLHECYGGKCWAKKVALEFQARGNSKYANGFAPGFDPNDSYILGKKHFKVDELVFVVSMGDLFGEWVDPEIIHKIMIVVRNHPDTTFLLQTKNPSRFAQLIKSDWITANCILGTTLETDNRYDHLYSTRCPSVIDRYVGLLNTPSRFKRFISIEPIMDFDKTTFIVRLKELSPTIIEIGADTCGADLPEPSPEKVHWLIETLKEFVPHVVVKDNLKRLLKERKQVTDLIAPHDKRPSRPWLCSMR